MARKSQLENATEYVTVNKDVLNIQALLGGRVKSIANSPDLLDKEALFEIGNCIIALSTMNYQLIKEKSRYFYDILRNAGYSEDILRQISLFYDYTRHR